MIKRFIHQEIIQVINIHLLNIRTPKYTKIQWEKLKEEIDRSKTNVENSNTSLSKMDRMIEVKNNRGLKYINQLEQTDKYRTLQPKRTGYPLTVFSRENGRTLSRIDHIIG